MHAETLPSPGLTPLHLGLEGKGGVGVEIALNSHSSFSAAWLLAESLFEHRQWRD